MKALQICASLCLGGLTSLAQVIVSVVVCWYGVPRCQLGQGQEPTTNPCPMPGKNLGAPLSLNRTSSSPPLPSKLLFHTTTRLCLLKRIIHVPTNNPLNCNPPQNRNHGDVNHHLVHCQRELLPSSEMSPSRHTVLTLL
jgi:hypothetical protein